MDDVKDWLVTWFKEKKGAGQHPDFARCNYFEAGFIDSFGIVELIMEIEEKYKVSFDQSHFQDQRFTTISGLAEVIGEMQSSANKKIFVESPAIKE